MYEEYLIGWRGGRLARGPVTGSLSRCWPDGGWLH